MIKIREFNILTVVFSNGLKGVSFLGYADNSGFISGFLMIGKNKKLIFDFLYFRLIKRFYGYLINLYWRWLACRELKKLTKKIKEGMNLEK